ncbi:beta-propeller fold lactonase family protein [Acidicapsa ligni]|uniref:beta-propeller fold lactonase family protein n=1 Tax=Acidicapsa ligni TaxID=542300 RepID=UPI0021E06623|nr:beta-propeller fold lactonase family protein [Acidicapsa ligni]
MGAFCALAFAGLSLVGCRPHDFPEYPANYREFAYVTNGGSNTVSVFDVVHLRLDREIQVGQNPTGVAANPKRNEIYVVNTGNGQSNGSVSVIDAEKNAVAATIPVRKAPYFIDIDAKRDLAYVANSGSNSVSVIDLKMHRETAVIGVGEGPGLARLSPDGKSLVVTNRTGNSVSVLDTSTNRLRAVIEGCPGATDAVVMHDSTKAFVACSGGHQVMVVALAREADANGPARPDAMEALLDVGRSPVHLALKPDGGEVFVSNFDSDSISEIVTGTDDVGGTYLMGSRPVRGLVSNDNSLLYVSNFNSQDLSIYGIDDGKRVGSVHVGDGPDALAFSAAGNLLFAVDARSGDVAVVRTSSRSLFTLLPTGRRPSSIVVKAFRIR